jgi:hypothetical protein
MDARSLVAGLTVALFAVVQSGAQQRAAGPPAPSDGAISGVVIDGSTKQPIVDAIVQLGPLLLRDYPEITQRVFTDARGRFAFTDLPPADYAVLVQKSGYFDGAFGATDSAAVLRSWIRLTLGQWFPDANLTLWRPASLSGTVTDERGEPVIGVFVRALARVRVAGVDHFAPVQATMTDDRGMYRVPNLHPGRYVLMVPSVQASTPAAATAATLLGASAQAIENARTAGRPLSFTEPVIEIDATTRLVVRGYPVPPPPDGHLLTYPIAFAGGTSAAQATTQVVEAGTDLSGVDVRLSPTPAVRISGIVQGPQEARANITLRLLPEGLEEIGMGGEAGTALVAPDGSFVFANVPSGNYTIEAPVSVNQYLAGEPGIFYATEVPRPPGMRMGSMSGPAASAPPGIGFMTSAIEGKAYWARTPISAGAQGASDVVVALQPTVTMRGRLVGEPDPRMPSPAANPRFVSLETATGNTLHGNPRSVYSRGLPEGEFAIEGILPGRYLLRGDSAPWTIKGVTSTAGTTATRRSISRPAVICRASS